MGLHDYLYGHSTEDDQWHALLVHDPAYVHEERKSEKLSALTGKDVMVRVLVDTLPGTGVTRCGLGRGRSRVVETKTATVTRQGINLDAIGVDPEEGDSVCPACASLVAADKAS